MTVATYFMSSDGRDPNEAMEQKFIHELEEQQTVDCLSLEE